MTRATRSIAVATAAAVAASGTPMAAAFVARAPLPMHEHVQLTLVSKQGTHFRHRGTAAGTVSGAVSSSITLDSLSLAGTVTVSTAAGALRLRVTGTARSGGLRARFGGSARVVGGSGRYARARGHGTFSGVVNRSTWSATLDASGSLTI